MSEKKRQATHGEIVATYSLELRTLAMQAAWIEWQHGRGAEVAMRRIENTLWVPGLIPEVPAGESAQSYYEAKHALIDAWRKDADARLTPAGAP